MSYRCTKCGYVHNTTSRPTQCLGCRRRSNGREFSYDTSSNEADMVSFFLLTSSPSDNMSYENTSCQHDGYSHDSSSNDNTYDYDSSCGE